MTVVTAMSVVMTVTVVMIVTVVRVFALPDWKADARAGQAGPRGEEARHPVEEGMGTWASSSRT
ncbi:hypothetical protein ACWGH8_23920 [Nonomuraea muscovyensis]|uniref:Uncharacterized protein n=1 Tax=Nonomuraea muscovyensis TaxID=1124761 RepID=A0A7X0C8Q9_9ACTN|nr:hypothetical protein [Nonomuraea muscovyensis]MBB6349560.1 hypothetical protein [Nonomuraea muscovyensis]